MEQWRRASRVAKAQGAFVAVSVAQAVAFICAPALLAGATDPPLGAPPYTYVRLLGVWELGLMLLYAAAAARGDHGAAAATVAGRLCVVPYVGWLTRGPLRAPAGVWAFVGQDIAFAAATAWALATTTAPPRKPRDATKGGRGEQRPLASRALRAAALCAAFVAGCADLNAGYRAIVAPPDAGADASASGDAWQLGRRSLGLAVAITGGYCCLAAATRRAYLLRPVALHHLLVLALRRAARIAAPAHGAVGFGWYRPWAGVAVAVPLALGHAAELFWWHLTTDWRRQRGRGRKAGKGD